MYKILKGVKLNREKPLNLEASTSRAFVGENIATRNADNRAYNSLKRSFESGTQTLIKDALSRSVAIIEEAKKEAEDIIAQARKKEAQICDIAFEKGHKKGLEQGLKEAKSEYSEIWEGHMKDIDRLRQEIKEKNQQVVSDLERESLNIALDIAKKIVKSDIKTDTDRFITIIRDGLLRSAGAGHVYIRLCPDDYQRIQDIGGVEILQQHIEKITLIEDPFLSSGDCIIDADHFTVDIGVSKQIDNIESELIEMGFLPHE